MCRLCGRRDIQENVESQTLHIRRILDRGGRKSRGQGGWPLYHPKVYPKVQGQVGARYGVPHMIS